MANSRRKILVTGASGQLGSYVLRELKQRGEETIAWSKQPNVELFDTACQSIDLAKVDEVAEAFEAAKPDIVIHAAAMSGVGACFRDPPQARQTNVTATRMLAELADRHKARLVYVSTDLVFDGNKKWYKETDCPAPLSVYGNSKASAERSVLRHEQHLVLRLSLLFGPSINGRPSFFEQQIQSLREGTSCALFEDEWRTPLSLQVAAEGVLAAGQSDIAGIIHLGGPERLSRLEMGQRLARVLGKNESSLVAAKREDLPSGEPRPRDTSLACDRWDQKIHDFERVGFEDALLAMEVGAK